MATKSQKKATRLKKEASKRNATGNYTDGMRWKVRTYGRLGKNNPNASKYKKQPHSGPVHVSKDDAVRHDVYMKQEKIYK